VIPRTWLTLLALTCSLATQAAPRTEILPLHYRSAEELLPVAQSLLDGAGRVSAYGNQLVINAEPDRIAELRELLQQLDTPPQRLLITVDSQQDGSAHQDGYRVDGSISAGNVEIIGGRGERHGGDEVRIIRRSSAGGSGSLQQVQATEGYPAQILVGADQLRTRRLWLPARIHGVSRDQPRFRGGRPRAGGPGPARHPQPPGSPGRP
jgi:hypothetical protein